ncbi:SpoIIE family protein phosphatase [Marinihelvus fidelis]|nr:SpoIIE family protein phosphatase [Marinihelvus fidelis]
MNGFHSMATRLAVYTLAPLVVLMLFAAWLDNRHARRAMLDMAETAAVNLAESVSEELQGVLRSTRTGIEAFSLPLSRLPDAHTENVVPLIREALERFPLVFGSTLAFDPSGGEPEAPYVYREGDDIVVTSLAGDDYRYWEWPWFQQPMTTGEPVWSPPYFDDGGGNVSMVTYSVPLLSAERKAILTADIRLGFLSDLVASDLLGQQGIVFIFDESGRLVSHPEASWVMHEDLSTLATTLQLPALANIPAAVASGGFFWLRPAEGINESVVGGEASEPGRLFIRPLNEAGWGIAVYFSDQDFMASINSATRNRLLFGLGIMALLATILVTVSFRSLHPLGILASRTRLIAQGDFSAETPGLDRADEIGRLSRAFHQMQLHLEHFIDDLTRETAARERIEGELSTARQIQESLVPSPSPDMGDLPLDLRALLRPARTVGGDLYNYVMLDENRLFFVIGDVSDKGIPAALFMAQANALLIAATSHHTDPGDVLDVVNRELSHDNEFCMFVTLMVGLLDVRDGRLTLANAAHDPPLLLATDGQARWLQVDGGPPAGVDADATFDSHHFQLAAGDTLVLYTDGVTEALSPADELFGSERLENALRGHRPDSAEAVRDRLVHAVDAFCDGAEAADDMTLLVIRQAFRAATADLEGDIAVSVEPGCHATVVQRLQSVLADSGNTRLDPADLELVVEELVTNVVKYSGLGPADTLNVRWRASADALVLWLEDQGVAFDPLADRDMPGGDDREHGGMGLVLLRSLTDAGHYERDGDTNRLRIVFGSLDESAAAMESAHSPTRGTNAPDEGDQA